MNKSLKKVLSLLIIIVLAAVVLTACGRASQPEPTPVPTPAPTATPIPTPTPSPQPVLTAHELVTVDAHPLESGSFTDESGLVYVSFPQMAQALGLELGKDDDFISFVWRGDDVLLRQDDEVIIINRQRFELGGPLILVDGVLYVPVEGFCQAMKISLYYDEEYKHLYCTPAAGDWEIPEGYKIPIFMYHSVTDNWHGDRALTTYPADIEMQLQYLQENGYQTIHFGDIANIEQYEKPVIYTFDDGYLDNYEELFPLLEKYQAKATFFIVTGNMEDPGYNFMNAEQVKEMSDSGLVDIQSHTDGHHFLNLRGEEALHVELGDSKLKLIRVTGKEPYVLCYPSGMEDSHVRDVAHNEYNYNFGLKMKGDVYVTGDDPMLIYRYYILRGRSLEYFAGKLEMEPAAD